MRKECRREKTEKIERVVKTRWGDPPLRSFPRLRITDNEMH
jgi:hypothetical protein